MAKVRIYELARDLDLESKEVLERAQELGLEVKTASSGVDQDEAELIKLSYSETGTASTDEAGEAAAPQEAAEEEPDAADESAPESVPESAPESEPESVPESEPESAPDAAPEESERQAVEVELGTSPEGLGDILGVAAGDIVKALLGMGEMVGADAPIPEEALELLGDEFNADITVVGGEADAADAMPTPKPKRVFDDADEDLVERPPVITVMGHVDHGKTTLLDYIRNASVVSGEAGGITQHIGAYQADVNGHKLTFIDTPGHAAFTAMRARGAEVTDIVVLVVAADDGPMPQTIEAINHSLAAGVNIIVAINKMDLPAADPHTTRARLTEHGIIAEELGGETITVELSAESGQGVDTLLEMIDLVAQVEDFKANPKPAATGSIIESHLDPGMGPVATVVVERGTLRVSDAVVAGTAAGRVRALINDQGERVKEAPPSTPVLIMGWADVPTAGDFFEVVGSEREARALAEKRVDEEKVSQMVLPSARERLQQMLEQLRLGDEAELRLIVKADAHGSLEALRDSITKITRDQGSVTIIHGAVGGINQNDVSLAEATEAIVVGFNVRPDSKARKEAEAKGIEIRTYRVIYELLEEVEAMLVGRLAPEEREVLLGTAEVRAVFKVPRRGAVAGCFVTEGDINRNAKARLVRDGVVVYDGVVDSLRRFKDDVSTVASGFECGIGLANFSDVKEGDIIESFEIREVART